MAIDKINGNMKVRIGDKVVELIGLTTTDITNINAAIGVINGLSVVATSGTAADVSVVDAGGKFTGTNVEAVLQEIAESLGDGVASAKIHLSDDSAGQSEYAKVYNLYQGSDDSDMTKNRLVGTINIAKDKVVQSGKLVTVTSNQDSDNATTTGLADGKYIKLTFQNVSTPVYINVQDLVDIYTTNNQTSEVTVALDANNNITATIGKVSASKIIYKEADTANNVAEETALSALTRLDNAVDALGIKQVSVVNAFTPDNSMTDGSVEFVASAGNINAVTYTGSNS